MLDAALRDEGGAQGRWRYILQRGLALALSEPVFTAAGATAPLLQKRPGMEQQAHAQTASDKKSRETRTHEDKAPKPNAQPTAMPAPDDDTLICLPIG